MRPSKPSVSIARLIAILALLASFGPFATDMYLSAFPEMRQALHTGGAGIATTLSVYFLGLALGQLVYGPISDRYGRRRPMIAGIALFVLASALCLVSRDIVSFVALRAAQALGGCCGVILGRAVVRDLYDETEIARIFSALSMISMVAPILAPLIGVAVILVAGWLAVFAFLLAIGLLCLAAVWYGLPESLPVERRHSRITTGTVARAFAALLARRSFLLAALTTGSATGMLFAFLTGSSPAFMGHFGLGKVAYGALFSTIIAAMIVGGQANRIALARHRPRRIVRRALGANLCAGAILLLSASGSVYAVAVALWCVTVTLGFILPNGAATAMAASKGDVGSASSLLGAIQFGAGFLSSTAVAVFQAGTVYPMAGVILGCGAIGWTSWRLLERASGDASRAV